MQAECISDQLQFEGFDGRQASRGPVPMREPRPARRLLATKTNTPLLNHAKGHKPC